MHKKRRLGFTLIEITVAMVLIGIGLAAVAAAYTSGRRFLKQAEDKVNAMSVASIKMDEQLAQSFAVLDAGTDSGITCVAPTWLDDFGPDETEACLSDPRGGGRPFYWTVTIQELLEGEGVVANPIPYKQVRVDVAYDESGRTTSVRRTVTLENIIPYPYIHIDSADMVPDIEVAFGPPYTEVGRITLPVYEVNKDIEVIYNISLSIQEGDDLEHTDTIYTRCFLIDPAGGPWVPVGQITRTPIISQPLFSNVVAYNATGAGAHLRAHEVYAVVVGWYKDTSEGTITLRQGNIIVMAVEKNE
jgi:prepilin-type N-terminal cleavage/methylation domain-containing protein